MTATPLERPFDPRRQLRAVGRMLADLVHPPSCIVCRAATAEPHALCGACWRSMPFIERPYCERLGTPMSVAFSAGPLLSPAAVAEPPPFARARAAVRYEGPARELVHGLKYKDGLRLVPAMASWMERAGAELLADADVILPVPMHRFRFWMRRFNQAGALASAIGARAGVPVGTDLLRRIRATSPQPGLTRKERSDNLRNAFAVDAAAKDRLEGKRVLLVDDVQTTGATAGACARALRKAGVQEVDLLVFACVVPST